MKIIVGLFALVASVYCSVVYPVLPASLIRSPQHDSSVVHLQRLNGNFAYSTVEGHAYQTVHPVPVVRIIKLLGNFK